MPLQYSGTPIVYRDFDNSTEYTTIEALKTALSDAGWVLQSSMYGTATYTGTNPSNNQTTTIGGLVYTFKDTINNSNAREVDIGGDLDATLDNLVAAIMEGAGKGTAYSTPTTANPYVTATHVALSGTMTLTASAAGASVVALSDNSNLTPSSAELDGGGYKLVNPLTPQRLRCLVKLYKKTGSTWAFVRFYSKDEAVAQTELHIRTSAARQLKVLANSYQFFTLMYQTANVVGTSVMGGVPFIFPHLAGMRITGVTIDGADALVSTVDAHALQNGDTIFISDSEGITEVNGVHTIQVEDADTVRITGINPTGVWTSGTGTFAKSGKIVRMIWSYMDNETGGSLQSCFRNRVSYNGNTSTFGFTINQYNWGGINTNGVGKPMLLPPTYGLQWFNNQFINMEPYIGAGISSIGSTAQVVAQLWDAILVNYNYSADITVPFDGHTWMNYTGNCGSWTQDGALFLAIS